MFRPDKDGNPICVKCGKLAEKHTVPEARECFPQQVIDIDENSGIVVCGPVIDMKGLRDS